MIKNALKPSLYHGRGKKPPFFEGWYFKNTDSQMKNTVAIIPGIYIHKDPRKSLCFIQVLDVKNSRSWYLDYPHDAFQADKKKFEVRIGPNIFRENEIILDINRDDIQLKGHLKYRFINPWPVSISSPGIMGWYAWVPFMECFHGVLSLDHQIEGSLDLDNNNIDFNNGRGYIEKDWGQAFPEAWIWQQSNHFSEEGISLTASIAIIPWIGKSFPGFIIGFVWENELFRFATYTGAKTTFLELGEDSVHWMVEDKKHILEMYTKRGSTAYLRAPTMDGMNRQIRESIDSMIEVRFSRKIKTGKTLIYQGTALQAGFEMEGNLEKLLSMI